MSSQGLQQRKLKKIKKKRVRDTQITNVSQFRDSIREPADMQISDTEFELKVQNSDKFLKSDVENAYLTPKNSGLSHKTEEKKHGEPAQRRRNNEFSVHSNKKTYLNSMDSG